MRTKILSYHNRGEKEPEESFLKKIWSSFSSFDKFTKAFIITFLLITLITPVITKQYLEFRQKAAEQPTFDQGLNLESLPGELLIKFFPGVPEDAKKELRSFFKLTLIETIPDIDVERVKTESPKEDIIEKLKEDPRIEYAEPNFTGEVQGEEIVESQNNKQFDQKILWNLVKINAQKAREESQGNESAVIAVIDSGVKEEHEGLKGKILDGYNFIENDKKPQDDLGHGTAVSGVIVSLGFNLKILPIKIIDTSGLVIFSNAAKAIVYATDNKAAVLSLGFGGPNSSKTLTDAINYAWGKNSVIVAPSGNKGDSNVLFPAKSNNVIAVGAIDNNYSKASFSNYGTELDLMAPGQSIYSTALNDYHSFSGTSFASSHAAGVLGLIISQNPGLSNKNTVDIITSSTNSKVWNKEYGWGVIDTRSSLKKSLELNPEEIKSPSLSITNPSPENLISGFETIYASANGDFPVSKVEFYLDDNLFAVDQAFPYVAALDSFPVKNGEHSLKAKAFDSKGNQSNTSEIKINIKN